MYVRAQTGRKIYDHLGVPLASRARGFERRSSCREIYTTAAAAAGITETRLAFARVTLRLLKGRETREPRVINDSQGALQLRADERKKGQEVEEERDPRDLAYIKSLESKSTLM